MSTRALALAVVGLIPWLAGPVAAEEQASPPGAPPNPVVFWELATHDGPRSLEFFKTVFGWASAPVPGATTFFHTVETGDEAGGIDGGVFTLAQARPAFVAVYILVEDIDAMAALVERAGGMIVVPPHEISPGTWLCLFNEPSGVTFAMLEKRPVE